MKVTINNTIPPAPQWKRGDVGTWRGGLFLITDVDVGSAYMKAVVIHPATPTGSDVGQFTNFHVDTKELYQVTSLTATV